MRRFSFKVADEEEELFKGDEGRICMSRAPFEVSSSSLKSRRSFCQSSPSISSALSFVSSRKSFSYDKLAQAPIHLTIVKLDNSSFEIEVLRMATVSDLKQAVESAFSHLPTKGPGKISWRHLWSQFCLSYRSQKLLNDSEYIRNYGVRDGDELRFVRHVSIAYNLIKKRSTKRLEASKPSTISETYKEEMSKEEEAVDDLENLRYQVDDNSIHNDSSMLSHLFRGWFMYSRLSRKEQLKLEARSNPSRWTGGFVGCLRSLFHFCDNRHTSYSSRVSQVEI